MPCWIRRIEFSQRAIRLSKVYVEMHICGTSFLDAWNFGPELVTVDVERAKYNPFYDNTPGIYTIPIKHYLYTKKMPLYRLSNLNTWGYFMKNFEKLLAISPALHLTLQLFQCPIAHKYQSDDINDDLLCAKINKAWNASDRAEKAAEVECVKTLHKIDRERKWESDREEH